MIAIILIITLLSLALLLEIFVIVLCRKEYISLIQSALESEEEVWLSDCIQYFKIVNDQVK